MAYLIAASAGLSRAGLVRRVQPKDLLELGSARFLLESRRLGRTVMSRRWPADGLGIESDGLFSPTPMCPAVRLGATQAIADVGVGPMAGNVLCADEPGATDSPEVEYNWERELYPLYLQEEVPRDAPLGLTVFDRPLVLYYDGTGVLNCLEDRCPHRAAKLSEGQIADGRLECLYHGWQFEGDGSCSKIPQLPAGAKIPSVACSRIYVVQESQGVIWVWLADKASADPGRIPWFEHYAREGYQEVSSIHDLPYDYSILLENLLDPAHVPISHDGTDKSSKRRTRRP